ncbi:unnamed protein product [Candidula unifasciata]|uniref:Uncharacterized protein n=1 Tax=Candidula unifasciata TaxID=100452 RepID=A0A8S3YYT5_9EUPU|nr:unnamed protein product [Candidula unifasciata]
MANYQGGSQKPRRRRKLPNIHHTDSTISTDAAIFWYSYHTAVSWIRSNEHIISKCIQLLQIYPNLIQDKSMDHLREFIQSLLQGDHSAGVKQREVIRHKREADTTRKLQRKDSSGKVTGIPQISVTESINSPAPSFLISARHARTPRVHLISRCSYMDNVSTDRLLHFGVLDMLDEDFYIRVTNVRHQSQPDVRKDTKRQYIVAESDVCVYLFNNATLEDASCFHDLCIALAKKIPVVYIRHHKQQLPKTFPDTINSLSKGCVTLKDYMHKFVPETHTASSDSLSVKTTRVKKKLAPLIVGNRSWSTGELNVNGILGKHCRSSVPLEIDLVFTLVSNFKNACVFDETDMDECCSKVKHRIHEVLGIGDSSDELHPVSNSNKVDHPDSSEICDVNLRVSNNRCNKTTTLAGVRASTAISRHRFLSVPDPQDITSAREWSYSGSSYHPPPDKTNHDCNSDGDEDSVISFDSNDARMICSPVLEQKATTYLIFDHSNLIEGPRKVEFPAEGDSAVVIVDETDSDDYDATTGSPINFSEIDLSREINSRGTPESDTSIVF